MESLFGDENVRPQRAPRKRALRTYGRRTQLLPEHDSEPPRKKRATEHNINGNGAPEAEAWPPSSPQLPKLPTHLPAPLPAKRGSILAFFKPVPPSTSSSEPGSQVSSDATRDTIIRSSPPSSPPPLAQPMKTKRRLRTRINPIGDLRQEAGLHAQVPNEPGKTVECGTADQDDNEEARDVVLRRSLLQELDSSLLNAGITTTGNSAEDGFKVKHAAKRRPRKPAVQTTLNLSMTNDPGFTICKDCDMLYNPLNDKDRKDHARQHAAAMRKKERVPV